MKGAIGNAFLLNVVITFIFIFLTLLVGSMAYSKAYKTKNFLLNTIQQFEDEEKRNFNKLYSDDKKEWDEKVNNYLEKAGYPIATKNNSCPTLDGYTSFKTSKIGEFDYCIYKRISLDDEDNDPVIKEKYIYKVIIFMKLDFPIIGDFLRMSITGETETFTIYR